MNDNTDLAAKLFLYFLLMKDRHFCQNLKFSLKHVNVSLKKKKMGECPHFLNLKKKNSKQKEEEQKSKKEKEVDQGK